MCALAKAYNILEENAHRSSVSASWLIPSRGWFEVLKEHPEEKTSEENYKTIHTKDSSSSTIVCIQCFSGRIKWRTKSSLYYKMGLSIHSNRERVLTTMQLPSELQEAALSLLKIPGITLFLGFFFANLRASATYLPDFQSRTANSSSSPLPSSFQFSSSDRLPIAHG